MEGGDEDGLAAGVLVRVVVSANFAFIILFGAIVHTENSVDDFNQFGRLLEDSS